MDYYRFTDREETILRQGKDRDAVKRFWTAVVILYIGFIFYNSLTPALESSRQSGGVLAMVLEAVDSMGMESGWITEHLIRKTAHFAEYTLLGVLLSAAVRQYSVTVSTERLVKGWLGTLIPLTDETIQLFVEGRSGQISDVWLDMAGFFTGILTLWVVGRYFKTRYSRKREQRM